MPHDVIMPALGMAQEKGQLVAWLKKPGDAVKVGDPLMEIETDKATMEVEAQADGYLSDLRAQEGDDVPVGDVVAVIADSPEGVGSAKAADRTKGAAPADDTAAKTPEQPATSDDEIDGHRVIMPSLGMSQDTGQIVAWLKAPGDEVGAEDNLIEIETDKATMEVSAGQDGFLAAILAEEGEAVPVGDVIAIISAEKPDKPVRRSLKDGFAPDPTPDPKPDPKVGADSADPAPKQQHPAPPAKPDRSAPEPGERILASPKARRLAAEEGLDLARLVAAGYAPPFHVSDLETLRGLPAEPDTQATAALSAASAAARHLTATIADDRLSALQDWMAETGTAPDRGALLAAFAAASLRAAGDDGATIIVATGSVGCTRRFEDPDRALLGANEPSDENGAVRLVVRDLSHTALSDIRLGAEATPTLTLSRGAAGLNVTLECGAGQLSAPTALALIADFAGRLGDPLRHLL